MSSLQEQLLKAGLVGDKQVKKANKEKRKSEKIQRKSKAPQANDTKLQAQNNRQEKVEKDRRLNAELKAKAEKKAITAQIKQLIQTNCQAKGGGDIAYNFTDQKKIKKIYVSEAVHDFLVRGRLAVALLDGRYELVPAAVADKIAERDASYIVSHCETQAETDDVDDPYADYKVPDDLMW